MNNFKLILYATKTFERYKSKFLKLFLLMLLVAIFESISIAVFLPVIQNILNNTLPKKLDFLYLLSNDIKVLTLLLLLIIIIIMIIKLFLKTVLQKESTKMTWTIKENWSNEIYQKVLLGNYSFIVSKKQGELINQISTQPQIACVTLERILQFYAGLVMLVAYISTMVIINYKLTIVMFIFSLLYYLIISSVTSHKVKKFSLKRYKLFKKADEIIAETISMIKQIKIFSLEKNLSNELATINKEITDAQVKFSVVGAVSTGLNETLIALIIFLGYLANHLLNAFDFKEMFPTLMVFGLIGIKIMSQSSFLVSTQINILANIESIKSINNTLATLNQTFGRDINLNESIDIKTPITDIIVKELSFVHNNSANIIKYGSFVIKKGKHTAIVGESGSGKSTFLDLLLKFHNPTSGQIFINDTSLVDISEKSWRGLIGYVTQEPELFNDTIFNNIIVGNQNATHEDVIVVTKQCFIHDFITSLEKGYETKIGDRGVLLSGGQKQRIAIARALIKNPEIIIFDEATSALDDKIEGQIKESIEEIKKSGKTIISIAHRKTTIENADNIINFTSLPDTMP